MNEQRPNEPQEINNPFANMNRQKNEMESQKKKTKIIIIISIVLISALLGYIIIDKILDNQKNKIAQPEAKENLDETAQELIEFIEEKNLDSLDLYGKNELLRVAINNICSGVYECKIISGNEVKKYIKEVFNKEVQLKDINCEYNDGILYSYDKSADKFVYNNHTHDEISTIPIYTKVNSIKKKDDKYILTLNKLYYTPSKSEFISSDPLGINNIYNFADYDMPSESGMVIDMTKLKTDYENNFDKIKNKGNKYRYTFSKKDKTYYLQKYENIDN